MDWDEIARSRGYLGRDDMLHKLYVTEGRSLTQLEKMFGCSRNTLRLALTRAKVPMRERGGPNYQKTIIDEVLLAEIEKQGVIATATARNIDRSGLYKALKRYRETQSTPATEQPQSLPGAPSEGPDPDGDR
jgi:hypothetical protein